MLPIVLAGQSPLMGHMGLIIAEEAPEKRMSYSLLHLLSVVSFPLSFLCMVLSPRHQTLGELLSGCEIMAKPTQRLKS